MPKPATRPTRRQRGRRPGVAAEPMTDANAPAISSETLLSE
eukprot:COSAG01_NODE_63659_length_279_cov_0.594444_1_plen_40_part_01